MTDQPIQQSISIAATPENVWRALTEPDMIAAWMLGARVESTWQPGSDIAYTVKMPGLDKLYRDRGTVLVAESGRRLKYSHWSEAAGLPDTPENRSVIMFRLDARTEDTLLTLLHEHLPSYAAYKHAEFFWGYALGDIKQMLENT
ncbi:SRPBCC domain-containing protein [Dyella humi]|uniref:SRPBCC domain-containing protein n=1 Tax=Dyella humi TaxID=1770547 RepID=A0ABW8IJ58_9GAMM